MPKKLWKFLGTLASLAFLVIVYGYQTDQLGAKPEEVPLVENRVEKKDETATSTVPVAATTSTVATNALVTKVVDGDTLEAKFDNGEEAKVRLLGINTPETVDPRRPVECFGKEASNHAKELLSGKRVNLVADPEADERDKYNRLLRKVFLEDGREFNLLMVHDGYAYAYTDFPMNAAYKRELKKAQEDAKVNKRGLWSESTCNGLK